MYAIRSYYEWHRLVDNSPTATFFQTQECYDFYSSLSFMQPLIYGVTDNGELVGVMCGYIISEGNRFKQFFSRRAIVPGGALLANNINEDTLKKFLSFVVKQIERKAIYLELRNYNDFSQYKSTFLLTCFQYQPYLNIQVDTTNQVETLNRISESKRRQYKLSVNRGVTCEQTDSEHEIAFLYECLNKTYQSKIKKPLFPIEFFLKLNKLSSAKFFVVKNNNRIIGGLVTVQFLHKYLYEWFVCGEDTADSKIYPSVVATMTGINYALNNKIAGFDFMGAGRPDKKYGVREFKSKFGGELVEHGRFLYICKPFLYSLGKTMLKILKVLPEIS